jgi:hypothetical protein
LWELLNSGIGTQDWFWYGEVGLYGDGGGEEWQPLLLRRVRQSNGIVKEERSDFASPPTVSMPDFYERFYKATDKKTVLSVLRAVHVQFGQQPSDHAPLTVFAALNYNESTPISGLRDRLVNRAKKMERLTESRYYVFLSSEHLKSMNVENAQSTERTPKWVTEYIAYVKTVMNRGFYKTKAGRASLYPHNAWLFALPIYTLQRGRPLLLAVFIIIARGLDFSSDFKADDKRRLWHLGNIEHHLVQLEVQATHILSHRYFSLIDGYVPGSDPIALLAHPSLAKTTSITALRMEGDTHNPEGFTRIFERKDSPLNRAFERSYLTPIELCVKLKIIKSKTTLFGNQVSGVDPHSWLKPLYAHRRERAHLPYEPSVNGSYNYDDASLKSLAALIVLLRPKDASLRETFKNKVFLYPRDSDDKAEKRFHWPVEPGVRFFIPWLNTVRSIADTVRCKGITVMLISGSSKPWNDDNLVTEPCLEFGNRGKLTSKLVKKWIGLRSTDKVRPNGIVVAFECSQSNEDKEALERQVQGWTRALLNPFGRRGDDINQFISK